MTTGTAQSHTSSLSLPKPLLPVPLLQIPWSARTGAISRLEPLRATSLASAVDVRCRQPQQTWVVSRPLILVSRPSL